MPGALFNLHALSAKLNSSTVSGAVRQSHGCGGEPSLPRPLADALTECATALALGPIPVPGKFSTILATPFRKSLAKLLSGDA